MLTGCSTPFLGSFCWSKGRGVILSRLVLRWGRRNHNYLSGVTHPWRRKLMQNTCQSTHCVSESPNSAHRAGAHYWEGSVYKSQALRCHPWMGWCGLDRGSPDHSIWTGRQAALWSLSLPSSPSQQKALRCKDGDGITAFCQIWMHTGKKCKAPASWRGISCCLGANHSCIPS